MQLLSKVILSALAATLYTPVILAQFTSTCEDVVLDGTTLYANCLDDAQDEVGASLNLYNCVGNYGGSLGCASGGAYSETCEDCSYSNGWLYCTCGDGSGGYNSGANVNLAPCINNYNGVMNCLF